MIDRDLYLAHQLIARLVFSSERKKSRPEGDCDAKLVDSYRGADERLKKCRRIFVCWESDRAYFTIVTVQCVLALAAGE